MRTTLLILTLAWIGCESAAPSIAPIDMAQPTDLEVVPDMARAPGDHPPLPLVSKHLGVVLASPKVWTVVWAGDEARGADINTFNQWMLTSDYFTGSLEEYGVGAGSAAGVIVLPGSPPMELYNSHQDFIAPLADSLASQAQYQYDKNTLFLFVLPQSATPTIEGADACRQAEGFHSETFGRVPYALAYSCGDPLTDILSHEIAEACTDPRASSAPGWYCDDYAIYGEIGDLCYTLATEYPTTQPNAGSEFNTPYQVTRLFSNKAAALGTSDPCVPAPSTPYFNVGVSPSTVVVTLDQSGKGTATALLEPFAFGNVGEISWMISDPPPGLVIAPLTGQAHAGAQIPLKVTITDANLSTPVPLFIYVYDTAMNQNLSEMAVNVQ